ncbi:DUF3258 domain-containing protein [Pseudoalteromonas piscicida]|uniref:DUF3258 domain-containing protein n=1 Tax=Pseudoalteromonas piscicida TaxID=43662 RepID=UPI001D0BCCF0|nr:site-specific integrase [Pseudoalteromonas piscicida]UDM62964.1 DUF3258 domain-containing protein [Pseudoalteromonas piscicida]
MERLKPLISKLKGLVIHSRTLDTSSISQQLNQIKSAMQKQLTIADIDPMIAKLEQSFSDGGHAVNALGDKSILELDGQFKELLIDMADIDSNEERVSRFAEIIKGLPDDERWSFLESMASVMKVFSRMEEDPTDEEGLPQQANELLAEHGFSIEPNSLPYRVLLSKLKASNAVRGELLASIFNEDFLGEREVQGLLTKPPQAMVAAPEIEVKEEPTGPLFSEVYAEFLAFKIKKEKLTEKIQKDYERIYTVWRLVMEDRPIEQYKPKDIGRFIDKCFELPRMNIAPYNKMSWQERVECEVPEDDLISPKSVQGYYKWAQSVFAYAKKDTVDLISVSPCSIKRDFTTNTRGAFSDTELKQFLNAANEQHKPWKKWIIQLGIYTGARLGELSQLRKSDIRYDEETKRHYILITDEHKDQKLKTDNAKRKIPIHKALITNGFLEYVASCDQWLFEELDKSVRVTGWMPRLMESIGVPTFNELGHKRSFHSFRHTFITKLMNDGVPVNNLQQVVGHEISSFGITSNYTHKATNIKNLVAVVDAFNI